MIRNYFMLSCLLVICAETVDAQRQRLVDSLHNALVGQTGAQRFPALYDLAFEYVHKDNKKALNYIEDAGKAALLSGNKLWIVKSRRSRHQDLLPRRTFSGACGRLATVKGLCLTAREEVSDPVARAYVDKIDFASLKVDQILRSGLRSIDWTNESSNDKRNEL